MEPWLLAVGAALLVGIAIWLVTRDDKPDAEPSAPLIAEQTPEPPSVSNPPSPEPAPSATNVLPPAEEATMDSTMAQSEPLAPTPIEPITSPRAAHTSSYSSMSTPQDQDSGANTAITAGIGVGTVALTATAVGGVLWYRRWQAERNKPLNRFRRRARAIYSDVRERVPDTAAFVDYLGTGDIRRPATGIGSLALVGTLLLLRAMRERNGDTIDDDQAGAIASTVAEAIQQAERGKWDAAALFERARTLVQPSLSQVMHEATDRVDSYGEDDSHTARNAGLGLIGAVGLGAVGYLAWRAFGRGEGDRGPDWLPVQPNS